MRIKRKLIYLVVLFIIATGFAACGRNNADDSPEGNSVIEAYPAFDLLMTPGPDVLRSNDAHYGFEGVSFGYSSELAENVSGTKQSAYADFGPFYAPGGSIFADMPDYVEITLQTKGLPARLGVQPIRSAGYLAYAGFSSETLQRISTIENDVVTRAGAPEFEQMPPKLGYIAFENGTGRRYLTFKPAAAGQTSVDNETLYYLFEGVTEDGRFLVWFEYPITTSFLANLDPEAETATILSQIDDLPSDLFTPDLAQLDAVVTSFRIEPAESFNYTQTADSPDPGQIIVTLGESNVTAAPDVYAINQTTNQYVAGQIPLGNGLQQVMLTVPAGEYHVFAHVPGDVNGTVLGYWNADTGTLQTVTVRSGQSVADAVLVPPDDPCSQILPATPDGKYEATDSDTFKNIMGCIPAVAPSGNTLYTVQAGDTLLSISRTYGVDFQRIAEVNGLVSPYIIQPGQTLIIPTQ
ncbi:MAG: LysM peptidoglycan-binding domain-containing protein [Anaerolineales bacterium]|nr:LysM peptidoglycan-binding domain-containing protein [Anaerolineales bacterium]